MAGALAWTLMAAAMGIMIRFGHVDPRHATPIFMIIAAALAPAGALSFGICGLIAQSFRVTGWVSVVVIFAISTLANAFGLSILVRTVQWTRGKARPAFIAFLVGSFAYEGVMVTLLGVTWLR